MGFRASCVLYRVNVNLIQTRILETSSVTSSDNSLPFLAPATPPDKVGVEGLEEKWSIAWEKSGVYRFNRAATREQIYSIDTPPPTVSGSLHVGHVFS